jgi:ATP-dependent RNA helicase DDX31/DBP7
VQREAIPAFLTGADVLVRSETGSGKTLSYIIPILDALVRLPEKISRTDGTFVVVIAPTRELVVQIVEDVQAITRQGMNWIVPGFLIGGEKKKSEKARLRKGVTILVATPGRLLDHLRTTESFKLQHLSFLVFDEADRLLDMGFEQDVRAITDMLKNKSRSDRVPQTALISATLWDKVMTLASLALNNPVTINVDRPNQYTVAPPKKGKAVEEGGAGGEEQPAEYTGKYDASQQFSTPVSLKQNYMVVPCKQRLVVLAAFIQWQMKHRARIIVFFSSCAEVDFIYALFSAKLKVAFYKLHGQMAQIDRVKSFTAFRSKHEDTGAVLVCTDAAARGLDFPLVKWIIQYDAPPEPKEYIHRVGRTARIGNEGRALLFLMPHETEYVALMEGHGVRIKQVDVEKIPASDYPMQSGDFEKFVESKAELAQMAQAAFGAFVKSYSTHAHGTKHIFHPKALHFGHVAKSFALAAAPLSFRKQRAQEPEKQHPKERNKGASGKTLSNNYAKAVFSEYDTGF